MEIKVGVSNRHVHLNKEDFEFLFGEEDFYSIRDLSQKGEFASNLKVSLKSDKNIIENVRVLGPLRDYTQVEISTTDSYFLGVNPPVRMSGDLNGSANITICNGEKELYKKECLIIAHRHIHINSKDKSKLNECVKIKIEGNRGGMLNNVLVKSGDSFNFELHLDTDEANAFGINNGDVVKIIDEEK